jgi:hypothetical protein
MKEFDDDDLENFDPDEDKELWKPVYALNKELQQQIEKISQTLSSMLELIAEEDEMSRSQMEMMLGDSWKVRAKLAGAWGGDSYLIYMENASIIRSLMREMQAFTYGIEMENEFGDSSGVETKYAEVLREEIEQFRKTFCDWVKSFEKDEFEDEWGLY